MRIFVAVIGVFSFGLMSAPLLPADDVLPKVPSGFTIEKVASSPMVKHPMMAGFDDRGRLFVAESAGKNLRSGDLLKELPNFVRMLEDTDGDGHFDKSTIFADKMTFPMGALWYRGALYVAAPPSIWKLEDTNDDGVADKRTELVDKFGFSGNGASVHGCFLGPCGRIYWCDGRHGFEFADGRKGSASGVFSCLPDGSDVAGFALGGMDNPVEVDFLPTGEMLGTVNIMLTGPRVDVLVHWMDGGAYPHQEKATSELKQTGELLKPMTHLGHVTVSGMMRYRSKEFGPAFANNIFTSVFNTHKIIRSVVKRSGTTFSTQEEDFLVSGKADFHPTDVLEDADGSLLVIDTGGWFRIGCPTSQVAKPEIHGAIYRIRRHGAHKVDDARGVKLSLETKTPAELVTFLNDSRPVVRERAVDLLASAERAALPVLATAIKADSKLTRRNAVWSLSRITANAGVPLLRQALADRDESVRLAAVQSLGTIRAAEGLVIGTLARFAVEETPAIRREAATALGRMCSQLRTGSEGVVKSAVAGLFDGLRAGVIDRYHEHALIYALIRIDHRDATIPFLNDPSPQVRRVALMTLDQMNDGKLTRELVVPLLDTDDPALQKETLQVIGSRTGWAGETLELLRGWLTESKLTAQRRSVLRGFLLAQSKDPSIQQLVAGTLKRPAEVPQSLRLLLLEVIDRSAVQRLPEVWVESLQQALLSGTPEVRLQAVRIIHNRGLERFDRQLRRMAGEKKWPVDVRVEALATIARRIDSMTGTEFEFLVSRLDEQFTPLSRLTAAQALADGPLNHAQLQQLSKTFDTAGPLAIPVLVRAFGRSREEGIGLALVGALGNSSAGSNVSAEELARLLSKYPESVQLAGRGLLAQLGVDLEAKKARLEELMPLAEGGNVNRGKEVFFGRKAACAGCHTIQGQGGKVGPDLSSIGKIRTGRDFLEAIAFPSSSFARGFRSYTILTDRGRVHTGVISRQSAETIFLRTPQLAEVRIPRHSIEEMRESKISVMPKGMDKTLSTDDFRDLVAYLKSRK